MRRRPSRSALVTFVAMVAVSVVAAAGCAGSRSRSAPVGPTTTSVAPTTTSVVPTSAPAPAGLAGGDAECAKSGAPPPTYEHVVWIFMENHTFDQVVGAGDAPFETALAHRCGTATHYASVGSPSLPNYIGATSGDTHGIDDDDSPAAHPLAADNLFRQVRASGARTASFEEAMKGTCALESEGDYAVRHNPAAYYTGAGDRAACEADDVALGTPDAGALADALDHDTLPAFSFVTPDLCNDTHNCGVGTGDKWLKKWIPRLTASAAYRSGKTAIFVAWDEYTPMPFLVVAPTTPAGSVTADKVDHYALLRTTEELLGIPDHLGGAAQAPSMRPAFGL